MSLKINAITLCVLTVLLTFTSLHVIEIPFYSDNTSSSSSTSGTTEYTAHTRFLSPNINFGNGDEIAIEQTTADRIVVDLCFGSQRTCIKAKLSTSYPYVWVAHQSVCSNGFDPSLSSSFDQTESTLSIAELYGYVKGNICTDKVYLSSYRVSNFPFLLTTSEFNYKEYQGALGLGYQYEDAKYSYIDRLSKAQELDSKVFFIKYNNNRQDGVIGLGGYPRELKSMNKKYELKTCKVIKTKIENGKEVPNNRWECKLDSIHYTTQNGDNVLMKVDSKVNFSLGSNINSFPIEVFNEFVNKYMKKYIDSGECRIDSMKYMDVVFCNIYFEYEKLGDVNYVIGKWSLKFKAKDLFSQFNEGLRFGIYGHKGKKEEFILGYYLFKKYVVVFDKYEDAVGVMRNTNYDNE
jgi:hypothetical protein